MKVRKVMVAAALAGVAAVTLTSCRWVPPAWLWDSLAKAGVAPPRVVPDVALPNGQHLACGAILHYPDGFASFHDGVGTEAYGEFVPIGTTTPIEWNVYCHPQPAVPAVKITGEPGDPRAPGTYVSLFPCELGSVGSHLQRWVCHYRIPGVPTLEVWHFARLIGMPSPPPPA